MKFSNYFSNRLSFILGDFNVDLLTASSLQSSSQFYNNVASCSLLPDFTKPTRITSNSQSIIDNIFTNFPPHNCLPKILVVEISDHFPIFFTNSYKIILIIRIVKLNKLDCMISIVKISFTIYFVHVIGVQC